MGKEFNKLFDCVIWYFDQAGYPYKKIDVALDLEVAMSKEERDDLFAMITYLDETEEDYYYVAAQIAHDLNGCRFRHLLGNTGFLPRSHGFSSKS